MGVVVMVHGWAFVLRLLHALSGTSIFFLVLERSIQVVLSEFGGILVVTLLLLLGAAACNYVLLGMLLFIWSFETVCLTKNLHFQTGCTFVI